MRFCTYDAVGKILSVGQAFDDDPSEAFAHFNGRYIINLPEDVAIGTHYVDLSGADPLIVVMPARPSAYHDFDYTTHTWTSRLADAIAARKTDVNAERDRRNYLPITVDGVTLDADLVAQRNLSDKKSEADERLRLGIAMPTDLLIWKDYHNELRTFSDLQAYADFISGFVIALAERGTRLYVVSWTHKDAIDALTNVEDVLAYDIDTLWQ